MASVGEAFIEIKAQTKGFDKELQSAIKKVNPKIDVALNLSTAALKDASKQIQSLNGESIDIETIVEDAELDDVSTDLASIDGSVIDAMLEVEDSGIEDLSSEIAALQGIVIDALVNVEGADLDALSSEIAAVDGAIVDLALAINSGNFDSVVSKVGALQGTIINLELAVGGSEDLEDIQDGTLEVEEGAGGANAALAALGLNKLSPTKLGVAAVATGLGAVAFKAAEVDAELRKVAGLQLDGASLEEADAIVDELVSSLGVAAEEAAPALYDALSAGQTDDPLVFLTEVNKLAVAGSAGLNETTGLVAQAANAYNISASGLEQANNTLFATVQQGVTTIPELAAALGDVTPIAADLGITWEELNAAVATSTQITGNTSKSVTGLKGIFSELSKETSIAGKNFDAVSGTSFKQFIDNGGDLQSGLLLIAEAAEDSGVNIEQYGKDIAKATNPGEVDAALKGLQDSFDAADVNVVEFFGSIEAAGVALQLTREDGEAFGETLTNIKDITAEGVAVQTAFDINQEGVAFQFEQLKNRITNQFVNIVQEDIGPALATGLASLNSFVGSVDLGAIFGSIDFSGILDAFADVGARLSSILVPAFNALKPAVEAVGAALGPVINFLADLAGFIASNDAAFAAFTAVLVLYNAQLIVSKVQMGLLKVQIIATTAVQKAQAVATQLMSGATLVWNAATKSGIASMVAQKVALVASKAAMIASAAASGIMTAAQWALNVAMSANPIALVVIAIAALVAGLVLAYNKSETFRNIVDGLFEILKEVGAFIADVFVAAWDLLKEAVSSVIDFFSNFGETLSGLFETLQEIPGKILEILLNIVTTIVGAYVQFYTAAFELGRQIFDAIISFVSQIPGKIKEWITSAISALTGLAGQAFSAATAFGKKVLDGIVNLVKSIPGKVKTFITNAITGIKNLASSALSAAKDVGTKVLNGIVDKAKELPGKVKTEITNMVSKITGAGGQALSAAKGLGKKIIDGIVNAIKNGAGAIGGAVGGLVRNAIPFFAEGGIVSSPTLGVIGEAGPEVIIPLSDPARALELFKQSGLGEIIFPGLGEGGAPSVSGGGGGGSTTINNEVQISVETQDGQDTGLLAQSLLEEIGSSNSGLGF